MTDTEKIVDKLRKLHAMAESAKNVGNEAEAQAFASMVQSLLVRHKLEMTDVEWEQHEREVPLVRLASDPTDRRKRAQQWETLLAMHVARASSCRVLVYGGIALMSFVGTQVDAEAAREAFLYLKAAANHLAEKAYVEYFHRCRREGDVRRARGYKGSWLIGFVFRLKTRYTENEQALQSTLAGTALIRLTGALARVEKELDGVKGKTVGENLRVDNHRGFQDGTAMANRIRLQNDPQASSGQLPG